MHDLNIGVIGSGGRGGLARYAHRPGEGSRVIACCDLNPDVFERNKAWYGGDLYLTTDYRELLQRDLDAVFITTPDFMHEEHAVAALAENERHASARIAGHCGGDGFDQSYGKQSL